MPNQQPPNQQPAAIDLRSDTVTRPTPAMKDAMMRAPLGDDVLGDDPTVQALEHKVAALLGKPAACFVPTGTMANQLAIRAQTESGDEIIAHEDSHIIHYETGAPAALSGCLVRSVRGERGQFGGAEVRDAVRAVNIHNPVSKLVVVENTQNRGGGSVWALERIDAVTSAAREAGLRVHLDGARLWNASVASGVAMSRIARDFDTVACCFSKGLGAPVGSAVAGSEATITRVRRFRKMFGGSMRQSGVLAAAAIYAMDHHVARLADDHANARAFASEVAKARGVTLEPGQATAGVETNIVYFDLGPGLPAAAEACERIKARGVWVLPMGPRRIRAVFHLDVTASQAREAAAVVRSVLEP